MLGRKVFLPVDAFSNFFLLFRVCFILRNSPFRIKVGIVQNNLFLLHIGGDNPLFTFYVFAL